MKFALASDLHLEFSKKNKDFGIIPVYDVLQSLNLIEPSADVLILAGDICNLKDVDYYLSHFEKWNYVIYVRGNHEHYGYSTVSLPNAFSLKNLIELQNEWIKIDGIEIYGGTGWFPEISPYQPPGHPGRITDHRMISDFEPWVWQQHQDFMKGLMDLSPDLVISHHLPFYQCVADQFKHSWTNAYFVMDAEQVFMKSRLPKVWCHGHTHSQVDTEVGGIKIYANPLGYPHERNPSDFTLKYFEI